MKKMSYVAAVENATAIIKGEVLPEGVTLEAVLERMSDLRESLVKKNAGERKETPLQKENNDLREKVLEILADGVMRNTDDLKVALGLPVETTPQRVAGILRPLVASGAVESKEIKRKRFYFISAEADAEV